MVVIGNYSVRLVNAETKEPFKEHRHNGLIYAEVEPELDYFVECEIVGGDPTMMNCADVYVDGKSIGINHHFNQESGKQYIGILSCKHGIETNRAFQFKCPEFIKTEGCLQTSHAALMGTVTVGFWTSVYEGMGKSDEFSAEPLTVEPVSNIAGLTTEEGRKKVLRSGEGKHTDTDEDYTGVCHLYSPGKFMEQININYCTALGLLRVGVLKKVDAWTELRMAKPWKRPAENESEIIKVEPKRIKVGQLVEDGGVDLGIPQKEVELFDLTCLPDDN